MRKNIFEILKNKEVDISNEIIKIETLMRKGGRFGKTLKNLIDENFLKWTERGTYITFNEPMYILGLPNFDVCLTANKFSEYNKLTLDDMFNYFELISNMIFLLFDNAYYELKNYELTEYANIIFSNIRNILERYGYKYILQEENKIVYIVKISEEATAVAENYEDIAEDVIEYKRFSLNGNLKRKRELLYNLSNKFEEIRPNLNQNCQSELVKDIGTILNGLNIRHNNKNEEYVSNLSDDELEMWYDKAYDTMLLAFMQNRYLAYKNDIKKLRTTLKTNK